MKFFVSSILVILFLVFSTKLVAAHPGNTAADGCHYCRTNCAKWGEIEGERHCHGGGTAPVTNTYVAPTYAPKPSPTPVVIPSPKLTPKPTPTPSPSPSPTPLPSPSLSSSPNVSATPEISGDVAGGNADADQNSESNNNEGGGSIVGLALLGGAGYGGYKWLKGRKSVKEIN